MERIAANAQFGGMFRAARAARASRARDRSIKAREREISAKVAALLTAGKPIRLELGAGGRRKAGWTSMDWNPGNDLRADITKPLPFPENSVERIYSSHTFEHFSYPHPMLDVLRECLRVLVPGGRLDICVPDASIYLKGYASDDGFDADAWCVYKPALHGLSKIDCVNYMAYMNGEHRHMFDAENLVVVLRRGGFADGALRGFDPELDVPERSFESLYAGGTKPPA